MGCYGPEEDTTTVLEDFLDAATVRKLLMKGGLTQAVADEKIPLYQTAANKLINEGNISRLATATGYWVPGRIEVVGKHTDYAGGKSLLGAVSKGFCIVAVAAEGPECRIFSDVNGSAQSATIPMDAEANLDEFQGDWTNYPRTTIKRLVSNFDVKGGVDFGIGNDIPGASGMSTSSAMICAVFLVIAQRNNLYENALFKQHLPTKDDLYSYLGCCENGQNYNALLGSKGVGTFGGSEDHTAIMSCTNGTLNMFSYCDTKFEEKFVFPSDLVFVIGSSGAVAEKTGDKKDDYNLAAFLSFAAADAYANAADVKLPRRNLSECVKAAREKLKKDDVMADMMELIANEQKEHPEKYHWPADPSRPYEADSLAPRFEQYYVESEQIVAQVGQAFQDKDYKALGELVARSQELTDTHLKNLVPETRRLPVLAKELNAHASSAFGAGFGGSCWAAVDKDKADDFMKQWKDKYDAEFPENNERSLFFIMPPGPGAFSL